MENSVNMRMGTSKGNPNEIGPCRAKDPGNCPHRSARMDMTQAEADSWMEARARESSDASTHSLSRSGGSSSGDGQSIMQRSRRRSCSSRGKASDARKTRIRKTMAVVMAATAMTSVFMTGPLNATATEATPTQSYSVSQAADKLDHAGEINLKLVEGKPDDLSGEQKYEVTADGDHVADVALKPGREDSTWSAVLKATSGGETGTAETGAIKDSAVTVRDAIDKQKSTIGKQREQGMSNGYEYGGQGGDVDMQAKQTGIYSFHYAHDVKSGSAEYKVESGSGDKNWSIETEEAPR